MTDAEKLLDRVKDQEPSPGLKEQLDEYRESRRAYDEMNRGDGERESLGREQRSERRYTA